MTNIRITALTDIGNNIAYSSLVPVVDMAGTPTTKKANLQIVGNLILNGAGGTYFAPAARAILAQSVTNAAQPNITSVGTLSNLVVSGNIGVSNVNVTGTVYTSGISATGFTSLTTLNVSTTANLGAVGNVTITGGTNGQVLTTNGTGSLSWTTVSSGSNYSNSNVAAYLPTFTGIVGANTIRSTASSGSNVQISANGAIFTFGQGGALYWPAPSGNQWVIEPNIDSEFEIKSTSNVVITTDTSNANSHFTFDSDGIFTAPSNVNLLGSRLNVGPDAANIANLASPTLIIANSAAEFIQASIINNNPNGSADWTAQGANSDDGQGYSDLGFTGHSFNDPNFTITEPGVGYVFSQGYANGIGGSLVLATGENGNVNDIIFATGGFMSNDEFARIDHANNMFHLTRANSGIKFDDGSVQTTAYTGGAGSELINGNNSFVLDNDGNVVFEGTPAGNAVNRGLVWDFGANSNGVNSTVRQDNGGLTVRAWTENAGNYAAPVNIVTNQDANTKTWEFDGNGNLTLPGNLIVPTGNIESATISLAFSSAITGITTGNATVIVTLADPVFGDPVQGEVTISSVTGTTEANGVWGYQATDPNEFQLYTDATITTPVDGTTWTAYVSGGNAVGVSTYTDLTIQGGNVSISSNENSWEFGADGNLTLPGNTFAVNYANGTPVSLSGGNTGNVTFDDNIVIGTGDEFGGGGLYLAPGNGSIANSAVQYLRVRGGDFPTHIHLDTGNNQYYDQYFGADGRYVKLEANGNVVLNADDYLGNSATWTLTTDGNLILAGGNSVIQSIANSSLDPTLPNVSTMVLTPDANYNSQVLVLDPTAPGHIHLRAYAFSNIDDPAANIFLGGEDTAFEITSGANNQAVIHSNGKSWTFGNDGNISSDTLTFTTTFANVKTVEYQTAGVLDLYVEDGITGSNTAISRLNVSFKDNLIDKPQVYIENTKESDGIALRWTFDENGNLNFPRDVAGNSDPYLNIFGGSTPTIQSTDVSLAGPANLAIQSDYLNLSGSTGNRIILQADAGAIATDAAMVLSTNLADLGNVYSWTFGDDGILTVPGNLVAVSASPAPSISGFSSVSALQFTNGNSNVTVNANSNLWNFDSTGNLIIPGSSGGFIKTVSNASIGIAAVDNGTNNPAQLLSLNSGSGAATSIVSAYSTNVAIQTNAAGAINTWSFSADGNLTLPGNTVAIKFANNSSAFGNMVQWTTAPLANTSAGTAGQAAYDAGGNLYVCVAANTWSKFAGTTSW